MAVFRAPGVMGEHGANWRRWAGRFIGQPITALEIGTYEGRSAIWWLDNILTHRQSRLICVDTWEGGEEHKASGEDWPDLYQLCAANLARYGNRVVMLRGRSHDVLRARQDVSGRVSLAYIDGSHVARDVLEDIVLTWPLLTQGGVLILDDYEWQFRGPLHEPKLAIDAFLTIYAGQYALIHKGYQVAVEKL